MTYAKVDDTLIPRVFLSWAPGLKMTISHLLRARCSVGIRKKKRASKSWTETYMNLYTGGGGGSWNVASHLPRCTCRVPSEQTDTTAGGRDALGKCAPWRASVSADGAPEPVGRVWAARRQARLFMGTTSVTINCHTPWTPPGPNCTPSLPPPPLPSHAHPHLPNQCVVVTRAHGGRGELREGEKERRANSWAQNIRSFLIAAVPPQRWSLHVWPVVETPFNATTQWGK